MKINRFKEKYNEFRSIVSTEFNHIRKDEGVILILIFAIIIYATVYSLAYSNEVLRDIPIAVVDHSQTSESRELTDMIDAAPNVFISYSPASMDEAKELLYNRYIYGIIYIPQSYEKSLLRAEPTTIGIYADASYFLMYRQIFSDIVAVVTHIGGRVKENRLIVAGANAYQADVISEPIVYRSKSLFNPYLGYGSFIMPAILILLIQQTLLVGIGMVGGTWRELGVYDRLKMQGKKQISTLPIVFGKSLVYFVIYAATTLYILGVHYKMFHYPMNGEASTIILFLLPYLLSSIFLGIAISSLFKYRESSMLYLLWTSIPLLLLSGASMPEEAIPSWLYSFGKIFPSSSGIDGFLAIQSMGADLSDVMPQYRLLWILTGVYFVLACLGMRMVMNRKDLAKSSVEGENLEQELRK